METIKQIRLGFYDLETEFLLKEVNYQYERLNLAIGIIVVTDVELNVLETLHFKKEQVHEFYQKLLTYDRIVGFNNLEFDNTFLAKTCCGYFDKEESLNSVIRFGKHSGTAFKDLPKDYVEWMTKEGMMNKLLYSIKLDPKKIEEEGLLSDVKLKKILDDKSLDIMKKIDKVLNVERSVSLNDLCKLTIGEGKLDGIDNHDIPKLIRSGELEKVVEYAVNDVMLMVKLLRFYKQYHYVLVPFSKRLTQFEQVVLRINL